MCYPSFYYSEKNQVLHASGLRIENHNFFLQQKEGEEMFFKENERVIGFFFNQLGGGDVHK
jgi:hypothetical protein